MCDGGGGSPLLPATGPPGQKKAEASEATGSIRAMLQPTRCERARRSGLVARPPALCAGGLAAIHLLPLRANGWWRGGGNRTLRLPAPTAGCRARPSGRAKPWALLSAKVAVVLCV